jgi:hypothetical protein
MAHYGMAFIPLAISGHISHVADEWLGEGIYSLLGYFVKLYNALVAGIPIGSQPFEMTHFIHDSVIVFVKFMTVSGGMLASLIALVMIARRWSDRSVTGRVMPHLLVLMVFWAAYLFIFLGPTGGGEATEMSQAATVGQAETAQTTPAAISGSGQSAQSGQQAGISSTPASPPAARAGQPVASVSFSLILPDIKAATYGRLDNPNVARWIQGARSVPGSRQLRLPIQGEVTGGQMGARVRGSLETGGSLSPQFTVSVDQRGQFSGDIVLNDVRQRIPLVLELLDPRTNSVMSTHRVVLY